MDEDNGARHPALMGRVDRELYRDDPEYHRIVDQLGLVLSAIEEALTSGAGLGREWILGRVVHHLLPTPQQVMEAQQARRLKERLMLSGGGLVVDPETGEVGQRVQPGVYRMALNDDGTASLYRQDGEGGDE